MNGLDPLKPMIPPDLENLDIPGAYLTPVEFTQMRNNRQGQ